MSSSTVLRPSINPASLRYCLVGVSAWVLVVLPCVWVLAVAMVCVAWSVVVTVIFLRPFLRFVCSVVSADRVPQPESERFDPFKWSIVIRIVECNYAE